MFTGCFSFLVLLRRQAFFRHRFLRALCQAKAKAAPADLVIVGGGLAGMSAAMALLDRGGSVVMVEKPGSQGWGAGLLDWVSCQTQKGQRGWMSCS